MFIDRATIFVRAGKGGDGCVSLRREKYVPKGGPDGGDGGDGGDVVLAGDGSIDTLLPVAAKPHYRAGNGQPGSGGSRHGARGADREVRVPLGTVVSDDAGCCLGELQRDGQRLVVARGGRGGHGNEHFKGPTRQTPRFATPGQPGEDLTLRLELKLIADVGLIGMPNAGKSTLLKAVSRATPQVADYPFTTRWPHLGITDLGRGRRLVIADIPGLIEGASAGAGLGLQFLRHVERTRVLVHLVEVQPLDGSDPAANYAAVRRELAAYSPQLAGKPQVVALSKIDLVPADDRDRLIGPMRRALEGEQAGPPHLISGATGEGVKHLLEACWRLIGPRQPSGWAKARREALDDG